MRLKTDIKRGLPAMMLATMLIGCVGPGRELGDVVDTTVDNTFGGLFADRADEQQVAFLQQLRYPADAPRGEELDIVVTRRRNTIDLANRMPRSYNGMQLWLNRQYVALPAGITIGTSNRLSLRNFVNLYGETYPVGGILSPDKGKPLIHAELFDPATGLRHSLTVLQ